MSKLDKILTVLKTAFFIFIAIIIIMLIPKIFVVDNRKKLKEKIKELEEKKKEENADIEKIDAEIKKLKDEEKELEEKIKKKKENPDSTISISDAIEYLNNL